MLGPVVFDIYVSDHDMPHNVNSVLLQFADDVKMFRAIQDFHRLQCDIDKLVVWCKLWQLNFNVGEYTIGGSVMASNVTVRDLGVSIDNKLNLTFMSMSSIWTINFC